MAGPAKLVVKVDVDSTQASQELDRAAGKINAFSKIASAALAFKVASEAVDGIKAVVNAASDLNETISAGSVIFGTGFAKVEKFAEGAARAIGQSKRQAIDAATTFATFGKAAGLSGDTLADFATNLTGLASDLASFKNTSPEEAILAIGAALRGEMEPIRKYGVVLDDATLRQVALKNGIISTTKNALTPAQKVLASNLAIWERTTDAQGDFARTSEGLANTQRILNAVWEDMQAELGVALLPLFLQLGRILLDKVVPAMQAVIEVGVAFFRALTGEDIDPADLENQWAAPFVNAGKTIHDAVLEVVRILREFWDEHGDKFIQAGKTVADFATTFKDKVGEVVQFVKDNTWIFETIRDVIKDIGDKAAPAGEALKTAFDKLKDIVIPAALETVGNIIDDMEKLPDKLKTAVDAVKTELKKLEPAFKDLKDAADPFLKPMKELTEKQLPLLATMLASVVAPLTTAAGAFLFAWHNSEGFRDVLKDFVDNVAEKLPGVIAGVGTFVREFAGGLTDLLEKLQPVIDVVKRDLPIIVDNLSTLGETAGPIFANLGPILLFVIGLFTLMAAPILVIIGLLTVLWAHFETFRNIVNTVIAFVVKLLVDKLLRTIGEVIFGINILLTVWLFVWNTMTTFLGQKWAEIQGFLSTIFDPLVGSIQDAFHQVRIYWDLMWLFVENIGKRITGFVGGIFGGLADSFRRAWNDVVNLWNRITIPGFRLFIGTPFEQSFGAGGLPHIPHLADGGIVRRPTVALIGERGPEAVVPLGRMGPTTTVNVSIAHAGLAVDSPKLQRDLVTALQRYTEREGAYTTTKALGTGGAGSPGPPGPQGEPGPTGPAGPKGDTGEAGATGPAGTTGATGAQGPQGEIGPTGATGSQGLKGDTGSQGTPGATGAQGPKGDPGIQGPAGTTGAQGPQGIKGDTGTTGPAGTTGAQGPAGPGLPVGGTTGQQAVKSTNADYAVAWSTERFRWG